MEIDPVCGIEVDKDQTQFLSDYEGKCYYFCSETCQDEFGEDPEQFISSDLDAPTMVFGHTGMN